MSGWSDRRRIAKSLSQQSWQIYKDNETLRQYARRAFIWGGLLALATILVSGVIAGAVGYAANTAPAALVGLVPLFLGSWLTVYVIYTYNAALVVETAQFFDGRALDYDRGLATAKEHRRAISRWALVQVIVGWILSAARDAGGDNAVVAIISAIVSAIVGLIWSIITFFVLPIILFENTKTWNAIKRSKDLAKATWGKQIRGIVRISIRGTFLYIVPAIVLIVVGVVVITSFISNPGAVIGGVLLVAAGVLLFAMGLIRMMAARLIFGLALYRYVTDEQALGPFDAEELAGSVRTRRNRPDS